MAAWGCAGDRGAVSLAKPLLEWRVQGPLCQGAEGMHCSVQVGFRAQGPPPGMAGHPRASHHLRLSPMRWLRGTWVAQQPAPRWPRRLGTCLWLPLTQLVPSSARHWGGGTVLGKRAGAGQARGWDEVLGVGARTGRELAEPEGSLVSGAKQDPPSHWGRSRGERRRCRPGAGRAAGEGCAASAVLSRGAGPWLG